MTRQNTVPRHVALIPDGNRRWSAKSGWSLRDTYRRGADTIDRFVTHCADLGVEHITVWPLSDLTGTRDDAELKAITDVVREYVDFALETYPDRGFRTRSIGNLQHLAALSPSLLKAVERLMSATADATGAEIIFAVCYSGRDEIARAFNRILSEGTPAHDITPDLISSHLDTAGVPDVDLIVRTGGDRRLSGFLPFQGTYSEIHFSETLLPAFEPEEMGRILERFAARRYSQAQ